jgi:hypothetical protein
LLDHGVQQLIQREIHLRSFAPFFLQQVYAIFGADLHHFIRPHPDCHFANMSTA